MTAERVILVVDDNEMNRDMIGRRLQRQGFTVETANDGQAALNMLRTKPYALVLLDMMMPNLSGYDVLRIVKEDVDLQHLPVIMISALDDLDSVVRCIELGADDYLFKPFNPVLLRARVMASLRRTEGAAMGLDVASMQAAADDLREAVSALEGHVDDPAALHAVNAGLDRLQALLASK